MNKIAILLAASLLTATVLIGLDGVDENFEQNIRISQQESSITCVKPLKVTLIPEVLHFTAHNAAYLQDGNVMVVQPSSTPGQYSGIDDIVDAALNDISCWLNVTDNVKKIVKNLSENVPNTNFAVTQSGGVDHYDVQYGCNGLRNYVKTCAFGVTTTYIVAYSG